MALQLREEDAERCRHMSDFDFTPRVCMNCENDTYVFWFVATPDVAVGEVAHDHIRSTPFRFGFEM